MDLDSQPLSIISSSVPSFMPPNLPLGTIKGERRVMPKRAHILGSCSLTMWLGNTMNLDGHWCPLSEMKRIIITWGQVRWWMYERVENHVWHLECSPPLLVLANNRNALTSPHWEIPCNSCWPLLGALATDISLFDSTQPTLHTLWMWAWKLLVLKPATMSCLFHLSQSTSDYGGKRMFPPMSLHL